MSSQSPSISEQTFLQALRAWGGVEPTTAFRRLDPDAAERLRDAWDLAEELGFGPETSRARLRDGHRASIRVNFHRVHVSWLIRALQKESPAVQRRAIAELSNDLADRIAPALGLSPDDIHDDNPPDLHAVDWLRALWTERLTGDIAQRDDDPAVILALTRLSQSQLVPLAQATGLVKRAYALENQRPSLPFLDEVGLRPVERSRLSAFQKRVGTPDPRLVKSARGDLLSLLQGGDPEFNLDRLHENVGLVTIGRLLSVVDPMRVRWALQHLPYFAVRPIRSRIPAPVQSRSHLAWEARIFRIASDHLVAEGHLPDYAGEGMS